jgi:hypothetical protein
MNAVLEFLDRMVGCELVDASPLEVRVITVVGGWVAVVSGNDVEIVEPAQILSGGLGVRVGAIGNRACRRRLAGLQDGTVDALFDFVAAGRLLKRGGPSAASVSNIFRIAAIRIYFLVQRTVS